MRTLLVCRGPIAFETLEVYQRCQWQQPHVIVSSKEWIADWQRAAPWIVDLPSSHVHYIQEYNEVEAVLEIAAANCIDAIYPGYGFLAENADFAERVQAAGIRFIGPTPEALRAVGDKDAAISLAQQLGISTIPGDDALVAYAQTHRQRDIESETVRRTLAMAQGYPGYPIRLKHPAGGGGKGQRVLAPEAMQRSGARDIIVEALTKLWAEIGVSAAGADARKGVLLELNIPKPLHWEVQLFGDGETVVHFAARDCSFQNHGYQKFIELALHPDAIEHEIRVLDPATDATRIESLKQRKATLERICQDALRLGQAIGLRGAATVEFLIDEQGQPYFLEVNPRIQVEHAVTEGVARVRGASISLVELQQRVAAGERLEFRQSDITCIGDAIEVRLNAWHEDLSPVLGGVVKSLRFHVKPGDGLQGRLRVDASGLTQRCHSWIVPSYDANFALIIVSGATRHETLDRMLLTLKKAIALQGNVDLNTNLHPLVGMLTWMRALPPETAFRTDASLLWMAMVAVIMAQKDKVLSQIPPFPRRLALYDTSRLARLIQQTLEMGFAHPSRLLAYYLERLTRLRKPDARPLTDLEILWQLAEEFGVPMYEEEAQVGEALAQAAEAVWLTLHASPDQYTAFLRTPPDLLANDQAFEVLVRQVLKTDVDASQAQFIELLRDVVGWLQAPVPAVRALIQVLEHTQIHALLTPNADLALTYPGYLADAKTLVDLHTLLSSALRPTMLRHGELLSPMEATIYHQPEPGAPPFVEIGGEVSVGQTIALLEAMKMFSELPSPVEGIVEAILVESGQGVKTGEPLFKIATQDVAVGSTLDDLPQLASNGFQNRFLLLE
jgi:acetyl/propionyl-CoA carboxylase alpha subunit